MSTPIRLNSTFRDIPSLRGGPGDVQEILSEFKNFLPNRQVKTLVEFYNTASSDPKQLTGLGDRKWQHVVADLHAKMDSNTSRDLVMVLLKNKEAASGFGKVLLASALASENARTYDFANSLLQHVSS